MSEGTTGTKVCRRCGESKPLELFHRSRSTRDGRGTYCKTCDLEMGNEWRRKNKERAHATMRAWKERNREKVREHQRNRASEKKRAKSKFYRAVVSGKLVKPDACENCGTMDLPLDGHHEDYSKPLEVRWLCRPCHGKEHRVATAALAAASPPGEDHE